VPRGASKNWICKWTCRFSIANEVEFAWYTNIKSLLIRIIRLCVWALLISWIDRAGWKIWNLFSCWKACFINKLYKTCYDLGWKFKNLLQTAHPLSDRSKCQLASFKRETSELLRVPYLPHALILLPSLLKLKVYCRARFPPDGLDACVPADRWK
jgi:hypothetical protein